MRQKYVGICVRLTDLKVCVRVILEDHSFAIKKERLLSTELLHMLWKVLFINIYQKYHYIIITFLIAGSIFDQECGNNPSFFADVYLHLIFIHCILDEHEVEECRERQLKHDKDMDLEESLGSRLYSSWLFVILIFLLKINLSFYNFHWQNFQ